MEAGCSTIDDEPTPVQTFHHSIARFSYVKCLTVSRPMTLCSSRKLSSISIRRRCPYHCLGFLAYRMPRSGIRTVTVPVTNARYSGMSDTTHGTPSDRNSNGFSHDFAKLNCVGLSGAMPTVNRDMASG